MSCVIFAVVRTNEQRDPELFETPVIISWRSPADNPEKLSVHPDRFSDNAAISCERISPEVIAQDDDVILATPGLLRKKVSSQLESLAKVLKESRRHRLAVHVGDTGVV